jgi:hypothetical protein
MQAREIGWLTLRPLSASGAGRAALEVGAVEVSAATTAGAQLGEFEKVVLDAFKSLVEKFWEAGDHALHANACLDCPDERFRRVHRSPRRRSRRLP